MSAPTPPVPDRSGSDRPVWYMLADNVPVQLRPGEPVPRRAKWVCREGDEGWSPGPREYEEVERVAVVQSGKKWSKVKYREVKAGPGSGRGSATDAVATTATTAPALAPATAGNLFPEEEGGE